MKHDYSLENDIFHEGTQYIEIISTDLNTIQIVLRDLSGKNRKTLEVEGFNSLNITPDPSDDFVTNTLHLLIGFTFEKTADRYLYCMKTNEHEMFFTSKNFPVIKKIEE